MADKITTLKLVDNTDVFPNTKEENIPDSIMRVVDLGKHVNALKSINMNGDINSTTSTADIATYQTADIGTLNVSGLSQFEGKATFGSDVEADGRLILNSADDVVDKDGNKLIASVQLDDFKRTLLSDYMSDRYSNHIFFGTYNLNDISLPVPSVVGEGLCTDWTSCYAGCEFQGNYGGKFTNGIVHISFPKSAQNTVITNSSRMFGHWSKDVAEIDEDNFDFQFNSDCIMNGMFTFWQSDRLKSVKVKDGANVRFSNYFILTFYACSNLTEIGAIDLSQVNNPYNSPFDGCRKLQHIHMTHFKYSFNISSSTAFEQSDLVEIISNLDPVSTAQTLTMGATNLAKLTQDQILVATGKGWSVA